jgi:hypothetical protein
LDKVIDLETGELPARGSAGRDLEEAALGKIEPEVRRTLNPGAIDD